MIMPIAVGQQAPDFTLRGNDDKDYKLSDLKGKNVVLAFYPLDFSPVCTNEHVCFRDDLTQFQNLLGAQGLCQAARAAVPLAGRFPSEGSGG
jgi:peroxiredoxin